MIEKQIIDILTLKATELWPVDFDKYEKEFNLASLSICIKIIKELGIFKEKGDSLTFNEITSKFPISEHGKYILKKILYILIEDKVLIKDGDYYILDKFPDIAGVTEILVSLTRRFPEESSSIQWLARASDGMTKIIKGEQYAEDILFPWSSFDLVEDVYSNSRIYNFYPQLGAYTTNILVQTHFQKPVIILEIGAGTGNGTEPLVNHCGLIEKYIFSDISKTLIKRSKQKFNQPFFEYKVLDITVDPSAQGVDKESIDIIYAVNVLHAANDIKTALNNIYSTLKKGGVILLSEISPPKDTIYRFMELTFGLLDSYSGYKDKDLRPIAPIIRPEAWLKLLNETGFVECETIPFGKCPIDDRGGVIIGFKK